MTNKINFISIVRNKPRKQNILCHVYIMLLASFPAPPTKKLRKGRDIQ